MEHSEQARAPLDEQVLLVQFTLSLGSEDDLINIIIEGAIARDVRIPWSLGQTRRPSLAGNVAATCAQSALWTETRSGSESSLSSYPDGRDALFGASSQM